MANMRPKQGRHACALRFSRVPSFPVYQGNFRVAFEWSRLDLNVIAFRVKYVHKVCTIKIVCFESVLKSVYSVISDEDLV